MKKKQLTTDEISGIYFNMLAEEKTYKEIKKATGIKKIEQDEGGQVVTLYYPNGDIVSHWV